jgi:hypothetical protein
VQRFEGSGVVQLRAAKAGFGRGGGHPLPPDTRQRMEAAFGTSFHDVRVHEGPEASAIGAIALTHGNEIYFAPGQYQVRSEEGQRLLARQLAHVVQQRAGRVRNPFGGGLALVRDPALDAEAERMSLRAAANAPVAAPRIVQRTTASAALRRDPAGNSVGVAAAKRSDVAQALLYDFASVYSGPDKATIDRGVANYRKQDAKTYRAGELKDLKEGETLYLYAHGSPTSYARKTPAQLGEWLLTNGLPKHCKRIHLLGCSTDTSKDSYAKKLEAWLADPLTAGLENIRFLQVTGSPATAYTTPTGIQYTFGESKESKGEYDLHLASLKAARTRGEITLDQFNTRFAELEKKYMKPVKIEGNQTQLFAEFDPLVSFH